MYVYSFGAPDHGKYFFDGLNGALKNKLHGLFKESETSGDTIVGTGTGYICNVQDVYDTLNTALRTDGRGYNEEKKTGK